MVLTVPGTFVLGKLFFQILGPQSLSNGLRPFRIESPPPLLTTTSLGASVLCPIRTLRSMLASRQVHPDELLLLQEASQWLTLTDSKAEKHLKKVSQILDLLTFHDYRERGCHLGVFKRGAH